MEVDQRNFDLIRKLVYDSAGLSIDERKAVLVDTRVKRRCTTIGCQTPQEYCRRLRHEDQSSEELGQLIESLTANETSFFQGYPQLAYFANDVVPELIARRKAAGERKLSVWSAACSTGDEAYTLAIILRTCIEDFQDWDVGVLATDIDSKLLAAAQRASYTDCSVHDVPDPYYKEFFRYRLGQHVVCDEIRETVDFQQLSLIDRPAMRAQSGFDTIFCRNALVKFNDTMRRKILARFYDALVPGGYLFLGHSESVGRISAAFEVVSSGCNIAYRKPWEGQHERSIGE
ncbi:protein-glutamate O-methyltransferase CheR [Stieleria sp. JC731]|uniref:CheR family methyltransferase n=1 Tax=Pirellulaceae TaxID=2691357 RepID=UPI001E58CE71|nr:protein-glutamate O-methyltransferase CheR [Stieleria sp. JC731]MCC9600699.1 protein-glutamate O-methyltransferase CheR [Stieleria sp. JC731]